MDPKLLTEAAWKALTKKPPIKDTTVQKALFLYEQFEDEEYADRLKSVVSLINWATKAKSIPEIKCVPAYVKYLGDMIAAAQAEQREIVKAKAAAEKSELAEAKAEAAEAKVKALEAKAAAEEAKRADEENEESEDEEDDKSAGPADKLAKALKALKTAKQPYYFLLCDAKPYGLVVSKKVIVNSKEHKDQLKILAGGSTRPPKTGTCHFENGKFVFEMEKPLTGFASILQKWINGTVSGLGAKVMIGKESGEDGEAVAAGAAGGKPAEAPLPPVSPKLAKAPEVWRATQTSIATNVKQLQAAVRKALVGEAPALVKEVEGSVAALDGVAEMLGDELPEFLKRAINAKDAATRDAELKEARTLVASYRKLAKGEGAELITHIDSNPFGVKTNLHKTLNDALTQMDEATSAAA